MNNRHRLRIGGGVLTNHSCSGCCRLNVPLVTVNVIFYSRALGDHYMEAAQHIPKLVFSMIPWKVSHAILRLGLGRNHKTYLLHILILQSFQRHVSGMVNHLRLGTSGGSIHPTTCCFAGDGNSGRLHRRRSGVNRRFCSVESLQLCA